MAVYLITGASSGIGRALCCEAAVRGHTVFGVARREKELKELAADLKDRFSFFPCDVADRQQVRKVCADLPLTPDVVILCAGVGMEDNREHFDLGIHDRTMAVNYFGALNWVEALFGAFSERKSGVFVGVSSLASYRGLPGSVAYTASKGALSNALDALRVTYRGRGMEFITVQPGFVDTPMTQGNRFHMPFLWSPEKAAVNILDGIQQGKLIINFPWPMRALIALARCLPARLWRAMARG